MPANRPGAVSVRHHQFRGERTGARPTSPIAASARCSAIIDGTSPSGLRLCRLRSIRLWLPTVSGRATDDSRVRGFSPQGLARQDCLSQAQLGQSGSRADRAERRDPRRSRIRVDRPSVWPAAERDRPDAMDRRPAADRSRAAGRRLARGVHLGRLGSPPRGAVAAHRGNFRHVGRRDECRGARRRLDRRRRRRRARRTRQILAARVARGGLQSAATLSAGSLHGPLDVRHVAASTSPWT